MKMPVRVLQALALLLLSLVIGLAVFWHPEPPAWAIPKPAGPSGGDFTLQSSSGPVSLSQFRGKVVLLYFGYTYCPDVCPTSLAATVEGLKQLTPDELGKVAMLFISVDPERDTPERLKEYATFFHPNIVGVTGQPEVVGQVARQYGVIYARQKVDTAGGYVVDHSSDTYVVGPDGNLAGKLVHAAAPDVVAAQIRQFLK